MSLNTILQIVSRSCFIALLALGLAACGGSDDDTSSTNNTTDDGSGTGGSGSSGTPSTGVFLDAEVGGIRYEAQPSGLSGTTNAAGEFQYEDGDTVTFSVGDIDVGGAPGNVVITPAMLAENASSLPSGVSASDVALNVAIFLQTLDSDGNPDNGIDIDSAVQTAASGLTVDFRQTSTDFVSDSNLSQLVTATGQTLVSATDAKAHADATLQSYMAGSWLIGEPGGTRVVLSLFNDGEYVMAHPTDDPNCYDGVEYGTYSVDSGTMQLRSTGAPVDTTGPQDDCGLYEDIDGAQGEPFTLSFDSSTTGTMTGNDADEQAIPLERVETNGFVGSWTERDSNGDIRAVLTLLDNGRYLVAQVDADTSKLEAVGVETGSYTLDADNNLSASVSVDTNGSAGLSDDQPPALQIDSQGNLTFEGETLTLTPVPE